MADDDQVANVSPAEGSAAPSHDTTVVLLTRNRVEWLKEALASALNQVDEKPSILVFDNASADGTRAYLDRMAERYPQLEITHFERELTPQSLVSLALGSPTTTYCAYLADDDRWTPHLLQSLLSILRARSNVDVAFSDMEVISATGDLLPEKTHVMRCRSGRSKLESGLIENASLRRLVLESNGLSLAAAVYRTEALHRAMRQGRATLDFHCNANIALAGAQGYFVDQPLVQYRVHTQNLSRSAATQVLMYSWIRSSCAALLSEHAEALTRREEQAIRRISSMSRRSTAAQLFKEMHLLKAIQVALTKG